MSWDGYDTSKALCTMEREMLWFYLARKCNGAVHLDGIDDTLKILFLCSLFCLSVHHSIAGEPISQVVVLGMRVRNAVLLPFQGTRASENLNHVSNETVTPAFVGTALPPHAAT